MLNPDQNDKLYVCARTQKQSSHTSFRVCARTQKRSHTFRCYPCAAGSSRRELGTSITTAMTMVATAMVATDTVATATALSPTATLAAEGDQCKDEGDVAVPWNTILQAWTSCTGQEVHREGNDLESDESNEGGTPTVADKAGFVTVGNDLEEGDTPSVVDKAGFVTVATVEPLIVDEEAPTIIEKAVETRLNFKNFLNFFAYVLNIMVVYGMMMYGIKDAGWIGTPDNGELSRKYPTIVTPAPAAFSIWAVIFLAQGVWAVLQLLPRFRAHPMVQDGVWYSYASVTATQIGWTFAFAYEVIPLSLAFMLAILGSLYAILYSQYYAKSDGSLSEFWALRFPFAVHAGWITAATALNVNVQVVAMDQPAYVQLAVAIVTLAVLYAVSVWVLFFIQRPNWTIACVLAWAFGWIYDDLNKNSDWIAGTFSADTILTVKYAAISVVVIICSQMVLRLTLLTRPAYNPYKKAEEHHDQTAKSTKFEPHLT